MVVRGWNWDAERQASVPGRVSCTTSGQELKRERHSPLGTVTAAVMSRDQNCLAFVLLFVHDANASKLPTSFRSKVSNIIMSQSAAVSAQG